VNNVKLLKYFELKNPLDTHEIAPIAGHLCETEIRIF
jgi:hypothetical protein